MRRTEFRALGGSRVYKGAIWGKQIGNPGSNGLPLLSVYADHERLFDPSDGLVTNPRRSGRRSEAPAAVSYFDRGRLALPSVSVCTVGIA